MTTIFLYLLFQFNISTSETSQVSVAPAESPTEYIQNTGGGGSWGDGE